MLSYFSRFTMSVLIYNVISVIRALFNIGKGSLYIRYPSNRFKHFFLGGLGLGPNTILLVFLQTSIYSKKAVNKHFQVNMENIWKHTC